MTPSRRDVLKAAGLAATVAGTAGLVGCSKAEEKVSSGPTTVKAADVPVGGGKILDGTNFVVTQPSAGVFVAFTRLCPHAGCNVNRIDGDSIICPCHGSKFAIKDGAVLQGPAAAGLSRATVKKSGDTLTISG